MSDMADHAPFAPSAAHRLINCPASLLLGKDIEDEQSPAAAEGTLAHAIGELKLRRIYKSLPEEQYAAEMAALEKQPLFAMEMRHNTDEYVAVVASVVEQFTEYSIYIEAQLDMRSVVPHCYGTGDCVIVGRLPDGTWMLVVIDYKNGKGVAVSAEDNPQLKLYALGALLKIQAEDALNELLDGTPSRQIDIIGLHIVQPRTPEGSSDFTLTKDDLFAWAESVVAPAAQIAIEGTSEPCPGPWCVSGFCKIRATCRTRVREVLRVMFDDRLMAQAKTLTPDEVAECLDLTEAIPGWRKGLLSEGFKLAKAGSLRGYKLVKGRSDRAWKDEKKAIEALKGIEGIMSPATLLSPAQIEGLVGKERFRELTDGLIEKPNGRETLVPESDRRAAVDDVRDALKDIPTGGV